MDFLRLLIVVIQEIVTPVSLVISDDRLQIDVVNTVEDVHVDRVTALSELRDQLLHLVALRSLFAAACRATLRETARTLDKVEVIVISPRLDIRLADHVHRTDQLHALKVLAVELRHHGLDLSAIQHSHQRRLDHIVKMMSKRDLVAAELFRVGLKISAAHSRAEITRALIHVGNDIEDIAVKHLDRDSQKLRVI